MPTSIFTDGGTTVHASQKTIEWIGVLEDGETVLWEGDRAKRSPLFYTDWASIAMIGVMLAIVLGFSLPAESNILEGTGAYLLLFFSGLFIVYQVFLKHLLAVKAHYILTNMRGYIVTRKWIGSHSLQSYALNLRPKLKQKTKGLSDVVFGAESSVFEKKSEQVMFYSFVDVKNGPEVYEILNSLWEVRNEV